jgi:LmbE family N-acetylglucosaminyl deacetylase
MNILVVAAHPDDEVLGCGGTIARLAREGHDVYIAVLGEGATARHSIEGEADRALVKELHTQSREAARFLGARQVYMHGLPDNRFDTVPLLGVVKIIEDLIERLKPEVIYTQHGGDLNIDHSITYRAALTATRPMTGGAVKELYAFEVPSATEWAFQQFAPPFQPNVFVDISGTLEDKIRAMEIYNGEMRPFPHPRSPEALRAIARRWGSVAGLHAAEAFQLVRCIRA